MQFQQVIFPTSSPGSSSHASRRLPYTQARSPAPRDRTPIRHYRPSTSRGRSHSRTGALATYATENFHHAPSVSDVPPRSAPATPWRYPGDHHASDSGTVSYGANENYSFSAGSVDRNAAFSEIPIYETDASFPPFYTPSRGGHSGPLVAYPTLGSHDASYSTQSYRPQAQALPSMGPAMHAFPPISNPLESTPSDIDTIDSQSKPQCWDHGCNGRQFSTFSNLLRHQREKSGIAMKALCPHCGIEFTRTTARNGHMYGGKCKGQPNQPAQGSLSDVGNGSRRNSK